MCFCSPFLFFILPSAGKNASFRHSFLGAPGHSRRQAEPGFQRNAFRGVLLRGKIALCKEIEKSQQKNLFGGARRKNNLVITARKQQTAYPLKYALAPNPH